MTDNNTRRLRWRLVLGAGSEEALGGVSGKDWQDRERAISFLYDRENRKGKERNIRDSGPGNLADSCLTVMDWINDVHELFPRKTIERIEKDALERYQLEEMVTNPQVLKRAQPSESLLKAVLRTKHLMNQEVLAVARILIQKVVEELMRTLAHEIRAPFLGSRDRKKRSMLKVAKNLDAKQTILKNLKHYDPQEQKLYIETPIFNSRVKRNSEKWNIIILLDQSGSMVGNVIHSSIVASIFYAIPTLKTRLIAFDTNIVDLSDSVNDPVETLMRVQLGGGTDIARAVEYASTLIDFPHRTIVTLISDFYEGGPPDLLVSRVKALAESGVKLLGLAALDREAEPVYDHNMAGRLAQVGMNVAAMTPGELALWVAEIIK
jgi:uncharacterized protein with von Willebrand factor type A (vWA) domain